MADNDLIFDDHELAELQTVSTIYLTDLSKFKKDDDHPRRQLVGIPQPDPFVGEPPQTQLPPRRRPPVSANRPSGANTRLCKIFSVLGFIGCVLFIFGFIATSTIESFRHGDHRTIGRGVHTGGPVAMATQDATALVTLSEHNVSDALQMGSMEFRTTTEIQVFVAYDLSESFPQLELSQLRNYRICCWTESEKFLCGSGYTFSNGLALDGYLAKESSNHLALYLLVNSAELAESRCELTLWSKPG